MFQMFLQDIFSLRLTTFCFHENLKQDLTVGNLLICKINLITRKAQVLNSLIINTTAKANDTTDILQTFLAMH